jgi:hypothetical protein
MATDSVMGLFATPEQIQMAQRAQVEAQMAQEAQMDPYQRANYLAGMSGYGLGKLAGGIMGAQDPQLKIATARRSAVQGMDPTNPDSIMQAAQRLSQVDPAGASQLAEMARAAALKKAQTDKAMRTAGATTVSERNREMIANAEIKLAKGESLTAEEEARVRWLVGQENKPKIFRDSETGEITQIDPIDLSTSAPNLAALVGKTAKAGGGVGGTVSTTPATKISPTIRKEVGSVDEQMTALDTSINKITALTPKIQELNLGLYQNVERGVSGFLGKPTEDTKAFKQLQREVRSQANNLLLLAKGTQTEGDAQRAKDQIADEDTWKNKDLLTSAFDDLAVTLAGTKQALQAKRQTLTSTGVPEIPTFGAGDVAPKKSSMSGMNPQLQPAAEPTTPQGKPLTQAIIDKANDAIKRGASRESVMKRLKDQGYTVQ